MVRGRFGSTSTSVTEPGRMTTGGSVDSHRAVEPALQTIPDESRRSRYRRRLGPARGSNETCRRTGPPCASTRRTRQNVGKGDPPTSAIMPSVAMSRAEPTAHADLEHGGTRAGSDAGSTRRDRPAGW